MCDYSQQLSVRSFCVRRAKVGDKLELKKLGGNVRGFAQIEGKRAVTCLRPGTEIVFERRFVIEGMRTFIECDDGQRIECSVLSTHTATLAALPRCTDGVEFSDGRGMALCCVPVGTRITVVQLPAVKRRKKKAAVPVAVDRLVAAE